MVAHALHHCRGAGISDAEPLPGHAAYKCLATGGAVECHISDDNILLGLKLHGPGRIHDQLAAGQALAEIVVAVPHQFQGQPSGDKGAEALAAAAAAAYHKGVLRQSLRIPPGDLGSEDGP